MSNILLHIPHASLEVPEEFYQGLTISKELFRRYNLEMCDVGIDELFRDVPGERVVAPFSRLYCDVERFKDDSKEPMSQYGEGVIYTHTYDGTLFHTHDNIYRDKIISYYDQYHRQLNHTAEKLLANGDPLLILDCHSFSDKMASHFFKPPFPDVCIGIEPYYYDQQIISAVAEAVEKSGYTYRINYPYKGSIVPNAILSGRLRGKITSIMVEVNKRVYL